MESVKVKIEYDFTPDTAAEDILNAVMKLIPNFQYNRTEKSEGIDEYEIFLDDSEESFSTGESDIIKLQ